MIPNKVYENLEPEHKRRILVFCYQCGHIFSNPTSFRAHKNKFNDCETWSDISYWCRNKLKYKQLQ